MLIMIVALKLAQQIIRIFKQWTRRINVFFYPPRAVCNAYCHFHESISLQVIEPEEWQWLPSKRKKGRGATAGCLLGHNTTPYAWAPLWLTFYMSSPITIEGRLPRKHICCRWNYDDLFEQRKNIRNRCSLGKSKRTPVTLISSLSPIILYCYSGGF